jgi:catechol 2,3-dioxygenase-like lactoylglutathione lyase family enzyme
MPLQRMEHYLVLSDDIEATRRFYCDLLGLETGFRPELDFAGYWLYLGETPCIHVADWAGYEGYARDTAMSVTARAPGTGPVDHIAFSGTGYDEITARLDARGVDYTKNHIEDIGLRQLFLFDPSGVKIELNFLQE